MITKPTSEQLQQSIGVICKVIGQIPCFMFTRRMLRSTGLHFD